MTDGHPRRRASDHVECETCDEHGKFSELLTTAMADLKWIRWTGYGILCVTGSFLVTIWSVLYPQIMSINVQIQDIRVLAQVSSREIEALKVADNESKMDRKDIRAAIERVWKEIK